MKSTIYKVFAIIATMLMTMSGCTQNDGDIGPWFGYWRLEKMTCDGDEVELYGDNGIKLIYWAFQGEILRISVLYDHNSNEASYAGWKADKNTLTIDFSPALDPVDNPGVYYPPVILNFYPGQIYELDINEITGSKLSLSYHDNDGSHYKYFLKKAY